jgi:putative transposase
MTAHQAEFPVTAMCRVLEVSTSGYYAWCSRSPSRRAYEDRRLADRIQGIHHRSRGTYGRPRVLAELRDSGERVSGKRVARLMRQHGLFGVSRRSCVTTVRDNGAAPAPDLVRRNFTATAPDQLWVADMTYVSTWSGFLYLAIVLDVFSRRIVGWATGSRMHKELVLAALDMAIFQRKADGVIHHSDRGTQYTSTAFSERCRQAGVTPSMGRVGNCYDNAMAESFNATIECELLAQRRFRSQREAELAIFEFIEGWYNRHRRHSALGYLSPANYERQAAARPCNI